jgi:hypothetical protein
VAPDPNAANQLPFTFAPARNASTTRRSTTCPTSFWNDVLAGIVIDAKLR